MREGREVTTRALPLTAAHVPRTARLLATTLFDDPAYAFLFPASQARQRGLQSFFSRHLATHVPHGCCFVCEDARGDVCATVTLRPPGGIPVPAAVLLAHFVPFAVAHGARTARRLWRLKEAYEALERRTASGARYWHVHMMAVRGDRQGKGVGSLLLGQVLARTASAAAPVVLTTHEPINVRFYERAGFRVAREELLRLPDTPAYPVWAMRREAS